MAEFSGTCLNGVNNALKMKRSQPCRRRRPDSQSFSESQDHLPLLSTPCEQGFLLILVLKLKFEKTHKRKKDGGFNAFYENEPGRSGLNSKRTGKGVLAPGNWKSTSKGKEWSKLESRDAEIQSSVQAVTDSNESKVKKVKLKVGGVMRTIHANLADNGLPVTASSARKNNLQGSTNDGNSPTDRSGLQGVPWKDFSKGGFGFGKEDSLVAKTSGKNISGKLGDHGDTVHKSKRVPKKRLLDWEFSEDDNDDEIRYMEKLKTSKISTEFKEDEDESSKKQKKISTVSNIENFGTSRSAKNGKRKHRSDKVSEDTDYEDEDELVSDSELEGKKKKKQRKEPVDTSMESKREITLTTRQRALQSSKDASSAPGSSLIEFPNGLLPAPSRKEKEKLSEVEQQLKKVEAAQRRRMQVEKANRESEAEAIRKMLGQDSSRKKREEKMKKRQEEMAQEKAVNEEMLASNTIRLVMGPAGTTVKFPRDLGFPTIFDSKPWSATRQFNCSCWLKLPASPAEDQALPSCACGKFCTFIFISSQGLIKKWG
ncbi:receptor-like serine/threonine-protein kinase ALE2-like isoform X1 [Hibiscus syriacus]|uniref:Receptor-like serine/threonine-protein kinase ALE2-like isoform X1 n=1 Tax=Hibiscus syriacus TaxID=106335 RepID=A0A6A2WL37_HIBSY|nr:receptor-like serine/threonine-protein kinase ALE2-like isoform X1 [Hibiscus syriacus]